VIGQRGAHHARHRGLGVSIHRAREVARLHRVGAPLAGDDRSAAQEPGDRGPVQRGRHHHDAQVVAEEGAALEGERQAEVGVETALVELVEDHRADPLQRRVRLEHPGEDALGDHLDAGVRPHPRVHPHTVAGGAAGPLAQEPRHPLRGGARCEAAWLQHHDPRAGEPPLAQERQGNACRLPRARWRLEDGGAPFAQHAAQLGNGGFDGKVAHGARGGLRSVQSAGG
jgi:hypothetical protein